MSLFVAGPVVIVSEIESKILEEMLAIRKNKVDKMVKNCLGKLHLLSLRFSSIIFDSFPLYNYMLLSLKTLLTLKILYYFL